MPTKRKHHSPHHNEKQQNATGSDEKTDCASQPKDYPLVSLTSVVKHLEETYVSEQSKTNALGEKQLFVQRLLCLFTFLGFVAASIYAGITYYQWRDLRHNFEVDQRAWIKVGVSSWPQLNTDRPAIISGVFTNIGKSVTTGMYGEAAFEIVDADKPPSFRLRQMHNTTGMNPIFPNDAHVFPIELWDNASKHQRAFTADEIQRLTDGRSYIATFGMFVYTDQFGQHWTRNCLWQSYAQQASSANAASCLNWNASGNRDDMPKKID